MGMDPELVAGDLSSHEMVRASVYPPVVHIERTGLITEGKGHAYHLGAVCVPSPPRVYQVWVQDKGSFDLFLADHSGSAGRAADAIERRMARVHRVRGLVRRVCLWAMRMADRYLSFSG